MKSTLIWLNERKQCYLITSEEENKQVKEEVERHKEQLRNMRLNFSETSLKGSFKGNLDKLSKRDDTSSKRDMKF